VDRAKGQQCGEYGSLVRCMPPKSVLLTERRKIILSYKDGQCEERWRWWLIQREIERERWLS
jgi:hypothetical protein